MLKKLLIFPFGGNARESLVTILSSGHMKKMWDVVGFIDDDRAAWGKECCGVKVLGGRDVLKRFPKALVLAVPGNPDNFARRKDVIDGLGIDESRFATIIHSSVVVSPDAKIGHNVVLMPHVFISCGVTVGDHCLILPNTVVGHDSAIGDYCCIGSNVTVSGHVSVASRCYIGSGAKLRNGVTVGAGSLVGLGSNVVTDVAGGVVVAGNPAKVMRCIGER
jgi:sugar O-acyltransferase (sialic acid O-acetyltransferase NeuD family)